ncbi:aminotransferase class III-fold pyridoxal phosphate-dependent enzyme [Streptomyces sp. NPDC087300]|uniref:aminotransferase class III-fold pyridoxal phosphate-dependent enzyme n=1 Tax=Streptomyces sp. NPDC087300 TaxID=3365780 RepID=UPI003809F405
MSTHPVLDWSRSAEHLRRSHAVTTDPRPDEDGHYPCVLTRGSGARVHDLDGNAYLDLTGSFGSVLIGHAEPVVVRAVTDVLAEGNLFYTGASPRRLALAERLVDWFPWAEQAVFYRTGSCAVSAAARLAQHATGRNRVLSSGYHGWHDWHLEAVPEAKPKTFESYATEFHNDLGLYRSWLERHGEEVAAVVVTPEPHRFGHAYYQELCKVAKEYGCLFVVDEVKTGFRAGKGGFSARAGIEPDAVTVSKGMANGHSISAVVGKRSLTQELSEAHVWSTYQNEQVGFAAALASLDFLVLHDVAAVTERTGEKVRKSVLQLFARHGLPIAAPGWGPMFELDFDEAEEGLAERLEAALLRHGIFCDTGDDFNMMFHTADHTDELLERFAAALGDL